MLALPVALVAAALANKLAGFDGGLLAGPGALTVAVVAVFVLARQLFFRRPVWVDVGKREIRWPSRFGMNIGTWRFDEVSSARLSKSWLRRARADTVLLRIGWIPLSFEVPNGAGDRLVAMLGSSDQPEAGLNGSPAARRRR
jgi:hypothetical protein